MARFEEAAAAAGAAWAGAGPPVVANYGCAGGHNGLAPIAAGLARVRAAGVAGPVVVAHVDLPSTDFSALFATLAHAPGSYAAAPGVHPVAVGRSIFEPALWPGSVALGWCTHAAHWVSRRPEAFDLEGHVSVGMASPAAQAPWGAVAAADWLAFWLARTDELAPGGRVLVELATRDEAGRYGVEPLYAVADRALADLVAGGHLEPAAARAVCVPVYIRSRAELVAPFDDPRLRNLALESLTVRSVPDPFLPELRRTGDASAFARSWTATLRAFTEDQFFPGDRDEPGLADVYYRRVADHIEADPEGAANDWLVADLVVRREA
jgi:hypothetical protein